MQIALMKMRLLFKSIGITTRIQATITSQHRPPHEFAFRARHSPRKAHTIHKTEESTVKRDSKENKAEMKEKRGGEQSERERECYKNQQKIKLAFGHKRRKNTLVQFRYSNIYTFKEK